MRLDYAATMPTIHTAMLGLEKAVHDSGLDPFVLELVKVRASQINGCAFCLEMHTADARAIGEDQTRLDLVAVWREASGFSAKERAALAWCESLTLVAATGAPDDVYDEVAAHFAADELAALTLAIVAINGWNRLNVGFRVPNGGYRSPHRPVARAEGTA